MGVAGTSAKAYNELRAEGKLSKQQYQILIALDKPNRHRTSRQLAKDTGLERAAVTGRLNALVKKNLVNEDARVVCPTTGKFVKNYRAVDEC